MVASRASAGFLIGFLAAVFLLQWWVLPAYPILLWIGVLITGIAGAIAGRMRPEGFLVAGACVGILLALLTVQRIGVPENAAHITHVTSTGTLIVTGIIDDAPRITDRSIEYTVGNLALAIGSGATALGGHILVRDFGMWPRHFYGEEVRIRGRLQQLTDEGYDAALKAQGIDAVMNRGSVEMLTQASWSPYGTLIAVREAVESRIHTLFHEPEASLMVGLLTGTRASFPDDLTEALRKSGLTHIVAISGFNVAIVLAILEGALFFLPRRWRLVPMVGGLVAFALFTGASASVIRACVMGGLGLLALHTGRIPQTRRMVAWAAALMLLWNPQLLWADLGFQLSFLSVLGILELSPFLEPLMSRLPNVLGLRESIALTLSSQLMAAPLILSRLGTLSFISVLANVLALPLVPWAMLGGTIAVIGSVIWFPLGLFLAFPTWMLLRTIILIAEWMAAVPWVSLADLPFHPLWLAPYYLCVAGYLQWLRGSADNKTPARRTERVLA